MCLILFAYRSHPGYELLVAANRDEFYQRPTAPLAYWADAPDLLAGRDLQQGGTWMGITRSGRFAALTNYRDPAHIQESAPSRGHLVSAYLQSTASAAEYLADLASSADQYNGFNLLLKDHAGLYYYSNENGAAQVLAPGIYGLSNHLLNTPWPKLERGVTALRHILATRQHPTADDLLSILTERNLAADELLPQTGVTLEWERWLSAIFIDAPGYGTRTSTVLALEDTGAAWITEMTWANLVRHDYQLCNAHYATAAFNT